VSNRTVEELETELLRGIKHYKSLNEKIFGTSAAGFGNWYEEIDDLQTILDFLHGKRDSILDD
jgi:hypothetical protein